MPKVTMSPPPGVVKPGTVYEAKDRWFDTLFVRWYEGVMQAIGGFDRWSATGETNDPSFVWAYDDGTTTYVDETADAIDEDVAGDVAAFTAAAANDALYIGYESIFLGVTLDIASADHVASDWTLVWEYWDGTTWSALTVDDDNTGELSTVGLNFVRWTDPGDWASTAVNGETYFWARARASAVAVGTPTVTMSRIWAGQLLAVGEVVRGTHSWRTDANAPRLAFGTPTSLYVYGAGKLLDATPASFTAGLADAQDSVGNYGEGIYGEGLYGVGTPGISVLTEAQTWQIDNRGELIFAVAHSDKIINFWDPTTEGVAAPITPTAGTVPVDNIGVVVTPENAVVALGAGGRVRTIEWSDLDPLTGHLVWDNGAGDGSAAGDLDLPGKGAILGATRLQQETLIWTTTDVFSLRFIGGTFVYTAVPVGADGAISRRAWAAVNSVAYWMGPRGFFIYNGYTEPLPCPLGDYVFNDLNEQQASKIWAEKRTEFSEITWHYPSGQSVECDRSITLNYKMKKWYNNTIARTAGEDVGILTYPSAFAPDGQMWKHEVGDYYAGVLPRAESGPQELGRGDRFLELSQLLVDEKTQGDVNITILSAEYPTEVTGEEEEILHGPFVPDNPTDVRITARQVRIIIEQAQPGWRFGVLRGEARPGGRR